VEQSALVLEGLVHDRRVCRARDQYRRRPGGIGNDDV
jgi:hypothetical protein